MTQTPRFALPLIAGGQAQKEVTHNEALARIDALLHLAVESRTLTVPPIAAIGQAWIVATGAVGLWADHAAEIALWDDAGWLFIAPSDGCIAFVRAEQVFVHRRDNSWHEEWPVRSPLIAGRAVLAGTPRRVASPSGGITIDAEARAAIAELSAALASAGVLATN